jgi:(p)ppGpp synthase/HD superfamily hydrolase
MVCRKDPTVEMLSRHAVIRPASWPGEAWSNGGLDARGQLRSQYRTMEPTVSHGRSAFSLRVDAALTLAAAAHEGQRRKGTEIPYVMHPHHVARILDRYGCGEHVVIAGLLHDVVEDAKFDEAGWRNRVRGAVPELGGAPNDAPGFRAALDQYIATAFGHGVSALVAHVTELKTDALGVRRAWIVRKREALDGLTRADADVVRLKAADVLHNMATITRDLETSGRDVMIRFNATPAETTWYYRSVATIVMDRLGSGDALAADLLQTFERFVAVGRAVGLTVDGM